MVGQDSLLPTQEVIDGVRWPPVMKPGRCTPSSCPRVIEGGDLLALKESASQHSEGLGLQSKSHISLYLADGTPCWRLWSLKASYYTQRNGMERIKGSVFKSYLQTEQALLSSLSRPQHTEQQSQPPSWFLRWTQLLDQYSALAIVVIVSTLHRHKTEEAKTSSSFFCKFKL